MRTHFVWKTSEALRASLEARALAGARRLARRLAKVPGDLVYLHGLFEEHEGHGGPRLRASLNLRVAGRELAARSERKDARTAVREAFEELERELERDRAFVRGLPVLRRLRGARERAVARAVEAGVAAARAEERYELLEDALPAVERYLERELRWLLDAEDVYPGEIELPDLLDAVLAEAIRRFDERPERMPIERWLLGIAARVLRREVDRVREARETMMPIELDVPEVPPEEEVMTQGAEVLEWHQPDEDWRLEDVLPALDLPTPEEAEAALELRERIEEALRELPPDWREAVALHLLEGLDVDEIAAATGAAPEAIRERIAHARAFLRDRLRAEGYGEGAA